MNKTAAFELTQNLCETELEELWGLFLAIHQTWGDSNACRPEDMASRWREFVRVKIDDKPSYLEMYKEATIILRELKQTHSESLYKHLLLKKEWDGSEDRLARMKRYVIDEFIRVYVDSGGFRSFGGKNYSGFVSGSRFRSQPPYRTHESE